MSDTTNTTTPTSTVVTLTHQRITADREIRRMIYDLVSVMYVPVRILEQTETSSVGCQSAAVRTSVSSSASSSLSSSTVGCQSGHACIPCGISYASASGLRRHNRTRHELIRYACRLCHRIFTRTAGLREHVLREHTQTDTPFVLMDYISSK